MFEGFYCNENTEDDYIRISKNQGEAMLIVADRIRKNLPLNEHEIDLACLVLEARAKDQINNARKYIPKNDNGTPADPRRYEIVLAYYSQLRVLKVPKRARDLVCYEYDLSDDNLKKWIKQEKDAGSPIKRQSEQHTIRNPETILENYEKIKRKK